MGNCFKHKSESSKDNKELSEIISDNKLNEKNELGQQAQKKKKPKSWENRSKLDREKYKFCNKENEYLIKQPGFLLLCKI